MIRGKRAYFEDRMVYHVVQHEGLVTFEVLIARFVAAQFCNFIVRGRSDRFIVSLQCTVSSSEAVDQVQKLFEVGGQVDRLRHNGTVPIPAKDTSVRSSDVEQEQVGSVLTKHDLRGICRKLRPSVYSLLTVPKKGLSRLEAEPGLDSRRLDFEGSDHPLVGTASNVGLSECFNLRLGQRFACERVCVSGLRMGWVHDHVRAVVNVPVLGPVGHVLEDEI